MIDITRESLLTFGEAAKFLPRNSRPSYSTWWRWSHGIRGVKLETVLVGGRRYTTAKAMQDFVTALSAGPTAGNEQRDSNPRRGSLSQAERELKALGIL